MASFFSAAEQSSLVHFPGTGSLGSHISCPSLDIFVLSGHFKVFHLNSLFADSEHRVNPLVTAHLLWNPVVLNLEYKVGVLHILSINSLLLSPALSGMCSWLEHLGKMGNSKQANKQTTPPVNKQPNRKHFLNWASSHSLGVKGHQYYRLRGATQLLGWVRKDALGEQV